MFHQGSFSGMIPNRRPDFYSASLQLGYAALVMHDDLHTTTIMPVAGREHIVFRWEGRRLALIGNLIER
jgi:hypothetical protein